MDKLITETEIKSLLVQERYYHIWRGSWRKPAFTVGAVEEVPVDRRASGVDMDPVAIGDGIQTVVSFYGVDNWFITRAPFYYSTT